MVFESYIVDLLNKYAGQYLENLDTSQLRLGIWGGDVKLENLILKESALDDLDLPVKVLRGHLGKLVLKIPWKSLYSEPVIANIEGLYLLVRPNTGLKYNAEKEEKAKQDQKKRQLEAVELAKQLEEAKKKAASAKEEKSDSFAEKFAMHVVKNLQVSICDIHIRYEDDVTNPEAPFSIGVTLENLSAKSTDEDWNDAVLGTAVQIVHKLVKLDSLALYWNTADKFGKMPTQEQWVNMAKSGVAYRKVGHHTPQGFKYILQPISATSKVKLDTKPGSDLNSPKVFLSLVLEEIAVVLQKHQYHDVMELLESFDRMSRNTAFRKYRPNSPLHKHAGEWWKYVITSILEEDVRRRFRNWSWQHIKQHRAICAEYKTLYRRKLLLDKIPDSMSKTLEELEEKLDVLNITICRQQAEYEEAAALKKKKKEAEEKKNAGWFSGWFGSGKKKKEAAKQESDILTEEQKKEELEKLYSAIGYSENEVITAFPKEYVENKVVVKLSLITLALRDDSETGKGIVAKLSIQDLSADLAQRPSAQAIRVTARVNRLQVLGSAGADGRMPLMVTSQDAKSDASDLFRAAFETNPLDEKCDQRVEAFSQPVKIVYDANTLDHVVDFFKPPQDVLLQELSAAAYSRLNDLKSVSKASLAYALEHHKITDVNIDVMSPYIIIPENGRLEKSSSVLLVDLGHVKITSDPKQERFYATKELSREELEAKSYEKFFFHLEALQVLIADAGDNWETARKQHKTKLHILDPMELHLNFQKSLNPDDIRLAQIKLQGRLPSIVVHVSDKKFQKLLKLALSIPIPGGDEGVTQVDSGKPQGVQYEGRRFAAGEVDSSAKTLTALEASGAFTEDDEEEIFMTPPTSVGEESKLLKVKTEAKELLAEQIKVAVDFHIEEVSVDVSVCDEAGNEVPCLSVAVRGLGTEVCMHPWDLGVRASLGSLSVQMMNHGPGGGHLDIVTTPQGAQLLSVSYVKVDVEHPEFRTTFRSTEQCVEVEFTSLTAALHQEALLELMELSAKFLPPSSDSPTAQAAQLTGALPDTGPQTSATVSKKTKSQEAVQIEIKARLGEVALLVSSAEGDLTRIVVGGLAAQVAVMADRTSISASMKDLAVLDSTSGALYPKILSIVNQEVFSVEIALYNDATSGSNVRNMEAADIKFNMNIGCIRVVFLNRFVMDLLAFLDKFQKAKEAVEYASKSAAESATATIQSYQSQSSRVSLLVTIQAPLIIVPVSSTSQHALVANLGLLTVRNSFNLFSEGRDASGSDAVVVDNMAVELSSVQVSRGTVKGGEEVETICNILEPFKLTVHVARNLSPWSHNLPDVDVIGRLHAVKISVGQEDLQTVMAVLSQNLAEGAVEKPAPDEKVISEADLKQVIQDQFWSGEEEESGSKAGALAKVPTSGPATPGGTVWDTFKFAFDIEQISAAVLWKSQSGAAGPSGRGSCLGEFSLVRFSTSGRMKSDSSLTASVVLENCLLDDRRPESEAGVTRMIDCHVTGDASDPPKMITMMYDQLVTQEKTIAVNICNVHVVVNLEFLLVLANVFTSALSADTPSAPVASGPAQTPAPASKPKSLGPSDEDPPQLRFQLSVKDPEIVLLADAKDKNTNALFLKNALEFTFLQTHGQQTMSGSVSKLSVISAAFDKERRESTKSKVLHLSALSLTSSAPEGGSMHVDIQTTPAHLHVSPPAIRTVTACLMSMAPTQGDNGENKSEDAGSGLWDERPIKAEDHWYLSPVPDDKLISGRRVLFRRNAEAKYERGLVTIAVGPSLFITTDSFPMPFFVDANDVLSALVDRIPAPGELKPGVAVIAREPEGELFVQATVVRTEDKDGRLSCLVRFSQGAEDWKPLNDVRVMLLSRPGVPEGQIDVSSIVLVRCKDESYMKGYVYGKSAGKLLVRIYDGGDSLRVDSADTAGCVLDKPPRESELLVGAAVLATYELDRQHWYPGHVVETAAGDGTDQRIYRVRFDDDNDVWISSMDSVRILPKKRKAGRVGVLDVGTIVWAQISDETYQKGFIVHRRAKMHIELYEGSRVSYELKDAVHRVLPDIPPKAALVRVDARVISRLKKKSGYHTGKVTEVDMKNPLEPLFHVALDGGGTTWTNLYHLRLLQKETPLTERPVVAEAFVRDKAAERGEQLFFQMESFDIKVEGISGGQLVPLLSLEGQVQVEVKDWSTKLGAQAEISAGATYFNERVSEWEPLLEPVEEKGYRAWELSVQFAMGSDAEPGGEDAEPEPAMLLDIGSKDVLPLTVTKSALDVFKKLGAAFGEAVSMEGSGVLTLEDVPPYDVSNELGKNVNIRLSNDFQKPSTADSSGAVSLAPGASVMLRMSTEFDRRSSRYVRDSAAGAGPSITVEVEGYHEVKMIPVKQARTVFQNIIPKQLLGGAGHMAIVIQVESTEGQKVVTIRSPLQIKNHFPVPMDLMCKKEQFSRVCTIQPNEVYSVPLVLAYKAELYLRPAGFGYGPTSAPLMWTIFGTLGFGLFSCPPPENEGPPFNIKAVFERAVYTVKHGMERDSPTYFVHLYPPVVLHNYLPYDLHYASEGLPFTELKGGNSWPLFSVDTSKPVTVHLQLDGYLGDDWRGDIQLRMAMDEVTTFTLYPTLKNKKNLSLELGLLADSEGTLNVTVYCPYWMVNKTGKPLEYKALDEERVLLHPPSFDNVMMFAFRGKKTTNVRVDGSSWSDKFSLDAVGSGGSLKVRKDGQVFEVGMQNTLSYFGLTKIVEFTPFYLLSNNMECTITLCPSADAPQSSSVTVNPGETVPFWPESSDLKNLALRVGDNQELSPRFNFQPDVAVMLRVDDKVGAVCVDMLTKESAAILAFMPYYSGAATVRIENSTQLKIRYQQGSGDARSRVVHAGQCTLYTWDEPTAEKNFVWSAVGEEATRTADLTKTKYGSFEVEGKTFHWVTFIDGLQRVLLVTADHMIAYRAHIEQTERVSQQIRVSLNGVGLSLVNDENSTEVAYVGIQPSQVIWEEVKKKGRWKALKLRQCEELEAAWQKIQQQLAVGKEPQYRQKVGDLEVDFELLEISRPVRHSIRRTFTPGIYLDYSTSAYQMLSAKINSIQVDSQLHGSMFQTVFHPVPPPRSLAAENAPKPFIELSLCTKQEQHSHVNEIKYFKVLIQEMDTRVDMGFLTALMELFSSDTIDKSLEASHYAADKKRVFDELGDAYAVQAALSDKRNYIDELHLSPLKIHLSFSQLGGPAKGDKSKVQIGSSFVSLLLQSVGVAVTEIQDVEFKLAFFEVKDKVYTQQQLMGVATKHYVSQALKQMYVLVLGLDVLGNPFALLTDLTEGARDLFYEPYQGLIQGPGEFVEGLGIGARSLLGHTVGGAAGAVSRITGTLGKGIAALTMDEKYKQERRQAMGKKPVNVKEGLTRGGKGLVEGLVGGITGIVTKPVEGAKEQGAAGFFKGLGKGVVGVVARPAGGLVDFASSTFEGIKGLGVNGFALNSSAETGSQAKRIRPARVFYADKVIRPYNSREAKGNSVLQEIKKSKGFLENDKYFTHCDLNTKKTLIITNKHIIVGGKSEIFDGWENDWACAFTELSAEPTSDGRKLVLKVPDKGKTIFKHSQVRTILTPSPDAATWLVTKIKEARS